MKTKPTLAVLVISLALTLMLPLETLAQGKSQGPPPWAPAHGYRSKVRHIYFPDYNFYFDLDRGVYIYLSRDKWEVSVKLPSLYASFDLKSAVHVELELDSSSPQKYNAEHKLKYHSKSKKGHKKFKKGKG